MELSYKTRHNILYDGFSISGKNYYGGKNNTIYNSTGKAIIVNANSNESFFVPTICLRDVVLELDSLMNIGNVPFIEMTYLLPMYLNYKIQKKTSSSIINYFLCSNNRRMVGKVSTGEKSYIGGKGIIMNKEWNPMIIWGYMVSISPSLRMIEISQPTVYISQEAYNSNDTLGKYIVRNIAPVLANSKVSVNIYISNCKRLTCVSGEQSIRLVTEDFSHLIYSPEVPTTLDYADIIQDKLIESLEYDH